MKYITILLILIKICAAANYYSNSDSNNGLKYIYSEVYQELDTECSNNTDLIRSTYWLSGSCSIGEMLTCADNGTFIIQLFSNEDCTGDITEQFIQSMNNCSSNRKYYCVDEIGDLPQSNSLISIDTVDNSCNWKPRGQTKLLDILYTNRCSTTPYQHAMISTCNGTTLIENSYKLGLICKGLPILTNFISTPECEVDNPVQSTTFICN